MNIAQIEENLQNLIKSFKKETFIVDLLLAFGSPKASISRLQNGNLNLSKVEGEISWKKKVFFRPVENTDLHSEITELAKQLKHDQRFAIVTDYKTLLAIDTKTQEKLDIELTDLPKHYDFFLPWAGMEKAQHANENAADVKAAGKMAKLFDEIKKDNPDNSPEFIHGMNVFLSRLLFCYFAEDTHIFADSQFTNAIASHTQPDGSDLNSYLDKLFDVLNSPERERKELPAFLQAFPFVNGGLFAKKIPAPTFSRRSRQAIIDSGELQWKEINPDIFGSMFQAVVSVDQRGNLGQHYTSVPNIMKVIEPLFLNELYEEFYNAKALQNSVETHSRASLRLNELLHRISKIKIFDPACGSGNFLIIAYKELRRLEMKIIKALGTLSFSTITLGNFYGIEIDDFAHEIAQLSLWLAEHQMNVEFFNQFGRTKPPLPLKDAGHIVQGNACRLDWEQVCPKQDGDEIYVLGNPPFLGKSFQNSDQKEDMLLVLGMLKSFGNLDYVTCWHKKAADYMKNTKFQTALVSTNSVCQGIAVPPLWKYLFNEGIVINFAHTTFPWDNSAKQNAAVYCVIIGFSYFDRKEKQLFVKDKLIKTKQINAYLLPTSNVIVDNRLNPLCNVPEMQVGSCPADGGNLIFTEDEYEKFIEKEPDAKKYLHPYIGSEEFINGKTRYCLWLKNIREEEYSQVKEIKDRVDKVRAFRIASTKIPTRNKANTPHCFTEDRYTEEDFIIIPMVSSERREYIPIGFCDKKVIPSNLASFISGAKPDIFSVITSKMCMNWVRTVGGKLKSDFRFSASTVYNTFPFPPITDKQKEELTMCTFRILEEREKHSEKTLAQLYDPDKMPEGLRQAHRLNDQAVERCYRSRPFESDEERLEYLFKLYEQMIEEEQNRGSLFAVETKTKKKRK
jgi:hypothetical protein